MRSANPLRQKMINMMYLVLIAMFLLNNPFLQNIDPYTDLNRSLENDNSKLGERNLKTIATIQTFKDLDSLQYVDIYNNVTDVHVIVDTTINFLENIKHELITQSGGMGPYKHLKRASDISLATNKIYNTNLGKDIKKKLEFVKGKLIAMVGKDSPEARGLNETLILDDSLPKSKGRYYKWDRYYFDKVPLNAVIAILSKFQNDILMSEGIAINHFNDQIQNGGGGQGNYNFEFIASDTSKLDTIYLAKGVKKHDVFNVGEDGVTTITLPVNKRDASSNAVIYTFDEKGNVKDSMLFNNGVGEVTLNTDQVGEFKVKGVVKFRYPDKKPEEIAQQKDTKSLDQKKNEDTYPFQVNYKVVQSKPYISQHDYKTLYIGINNPVDVYHPEYNPKDYKVSITQGKVINVGNDFYAVPSREGFASLKLEVPDGSGGYKKVAEEIFKVRELPRPEVSLYNKEGGSIPAKIFKMQKGLNTSSKELPVDVNFRVTDFSVTYINANGLGKFTENVKGSYFTGKSKELIDLAQPGDIFIFDNIHVKGPDGLNKSVDALVFSIL